ncbi:MAG: hypothetical protein FJ042_02245 [Candidatus Cloacimonetes bacterium]|nr:hypothetical protein [Candidatus Cloacimonadota bacterium]
MKMLLLIAIVFALLLSACVTRLVDFTIISTKNIDLSRASTFQRAGSRITGEDAVHIIIILPTGTPNMKEAIDKALESVNGAVALVDGVLYSKFFYIPYIYGKSAYIVEGTPLIDPQRADSEIPPGYYLLALNEAGNKYELNEVTEAEYNRIRKHK